jgi:Flp pilus assembly protein TadD
MWYTRALDVDGWKTPTVLREAGEHRLLVGDVHEAVEVFEQAVRLHPGDHGFWAGLGRALAADGDHDGARAALERALELNPDNDQAREALTRLG